MELSRAKVLTLVISTLLRASTALADSIVVNGGFEDPIVPYASGFTLFGSVPGWQFADITGLEVHRFLNGWLPYEGSQYIEATSQDNIFQYLHTKAGTNYILSYAYSPRPGVDVNPLEVYWDGQLIATHNSSGAGNANTAWTVFTFGVVASSDLTLLELKSPRLDVGTYVDGVSVTTAVPLPAASSLALFCFGMLAAVRRVRH